jgi:hypothetical protein
MYGASNRNSLLLTPKSTKSRILDVTALQQSKVASFQTNLWVRMRNEKSDFFQEQKEILG